MFKERKIRNSEIPRGYDYKGEAEKHGKGGAGRIPAVMHPVESVWMLMGPNEQTGEELLDLDKQLDELVNRLLFGCIDFDFVAESLLAKQSAKAAGQTDELSAHGSRGAGPRNFVWAVWLMM